ncbi:Zn-binding Pro-Ala-Ala-Arg (PAAR) domain-containing protein, incolved in TypeVI secretion [Dyella jiangningensis]|uniref:PAAR domain-containing protein n=1 Tax=Dyella sp. AtDHG13 TaxID=1938897 RepID=UPI0008881676|nr:PAAR domain-containing protein [Dyella sp. AtDHG13]PXV52835.1 putative Zn-binding protein involved in type VI secretion [Dyella sp. AtDHG13]SDK30753.1 Zn-binding Pro-Ala-Ala-Arg (PAAR) domain-containing protein, incolved in TypeVI secretion [Dyella jiangningensis]
MSFPHKRPALHGDTTTHGGSIEATGRFKINGRRVALINDIVHCPRCGATTINQGDEGLRGGAKVALHGATTSCGATVISSLSP